MSGPHTYKALNADIAIEVGYLGRSRKLSYDLRAGDNDPVEVSSLEAGKALAEQKLGRPLKWVEVYE